MVFGSVHPAFYQLRAAFVVFKRLPDVKGGGEYALLLLLRLICPPIRPVLLQAASVGLQGRHDAASAGLYLQHFPPSRVWLQTSLPKLPCLSHTPLAGAAGPGATVGNNSIVKFTPRGICCCMQ